MYVGSGMNFSKTEGVYSMNFRSNEFGITLFDIYTPNIPTKPLFSVEMERFYNFLYVELSFF